jgi:hypothetical protein
MIISRRMIWVGHIARMGRGGIHVGFWLESQKIKRLLGRPRRRWEDNIIIDFRGQDGVVWTGLIWLRIGISGGRL